MNPNKRADELVAQAREAVAALSERYGVLTLELAWLDGYKAGMDAVRTKADAAFKMLEAEMTT